MAMEDNDEPASVLKQLSWTREVERAREATMQARVASLLLGEELERLRGELAAAKTRLAATAAEIPPLKSQIESIYGAVAERQAEAGKKQAAVEELRCRVDRGRAELRRLRAEAAAAQGAKDALERRVLIRRQSARVLRLAERAVAAEAHALVWSAGVAAKQAARAAGDDGYDGGEEEAVVTLPARRLEELREAVEAAEREAEARVEEAEAMRRSAKASRVAAVARLDAARAKRREADAELRRRMMDRGDEGHGKKARKGVPSLRNRSFTVKKLRRFLCSSVARG